MMDSEIVAFTARAKSSVVLWNIIGAAMVFCAHYHTHTLMKNCQTTPVYTHPKPTGCLNYNHSMEKTFPKEMLDILDNSTGNRAMMVTPLVKEYAIMGHWITLGLELSGIGRRKRSMGK